MKSILVTGSNGFLGKRLTKALRAKKLQVIEWDRQNGDIIDEKSFNSLQELKHVFHLASQTFVPKSWENPSLFYRTSLMGTLNVLELCQRANASLTFISSYIYGQPDFFPVSESAAPRPTNPYAHSKYLAEQLIEFYSVHFGIKATIFRPFNIYGPGQNHTFLIPSIIRQIKEAEQIVVKDLTPKRDYIYVDDVIEALLSSFNQQTQFEIFNLASGVSVDPTEIIRIALKLNGIEKEVVCESVPRKNEIPDTQGDIEKAKKILGWAPKVSLEQGIQEILSQWTS